MKFLFCLPIALLVYFTSCNALGACKNGVVIIERFRLPNGEGGELSVENVVLESSFDWVPGISEPPISIDEVIALSGWSGLYGIRLTRTGCGDRKRWVYVLRFDDGGKEKFVGVLMNGVIINGTVVDGGGGE